MRLDASNTRRVMPLAQGIYYAATGVWPLVSIRHFQGFTGPKMETWLVKTVGLLVTAIGASLIVSALNPRRSPGLDALVLGAGSAAALAGVDLHYTRKGRISPIYRADALAEGILVAGWAAAPLLARRRPARRLAGLRRILPV